MADFSLTTVFVVPVGQTALPSSGSTQNLTAGQFGIYLNDYSFATAGNIAAAPYFYLAQGRENTYLQGSKRSDKIKGCATANCNSNVTEWYKVSGCSTPATQITEVSGFSVGCGEVLTLTLRAHSSYIDTLYFNGFTRSVTIQAPCCDCDGGDPCVDVDENALINQLIAKLVQTVPGTNPDNISFSTFWNFENIGGTILRISAKPLTAYGQPCDVAAFPFEYDRMWFRTFVYSGPATTADFIVADSCNIVATSVITQRSSYATGTSEEIAQLEKNYYSYQAGYLKHLYRMAGYNENFETYVNSGSNYTTYYIKFNDIDKTAQNWNANLPTDSAVIIAAVTDSAVATEIESVLEAALGTVLDNNACITTTTTTTGAPTTTTSSSTTNIP